MSKPIFELVDNLPTKNITTMMLQSLDFVVPQQWQNIVGFENTIRAVTGESDREMIQQIGDRAVWLYNDKSQGYQRAMWLYQSVDSADSALGAAALATGLATGLAAFTAFLGAAFLDTALAAGFAIFFAGAAFFAAGFFVAITF